jgi:YfiR/HmsC-like
LTFVKTPQSRLRWLGGATRVRFALLLALGAGGVTAAEPSAPAVQASREYDLKAALLFNFTRFVEWPARAFGRPEAPVVIGILGQDPFGRVLDEMVNNEKCAGRPIVVARFSNVAAVRDCHLLFIGAGERGNMLRIAAALRGRPILTVGDFDGFTAAGGMIRLQKNPADKIQLRINLNAIKAADLSISAKLLRVAEAVNPAGD